MNYTSRFKKIAITLFTSDISDSETTVAKTLVDTLDKIGKDISHWVEKIEENLDKMNEYHGNASSLKSARTYFKDAMDKQKEKYEHIRNDLGRLLDNKKGNKTQIDEIKDLKMIEDIDSILQESEKFNEICNKYFDNSSFIGENDFIEEFKQASQDIVDAKDSFVDIINTVADRVNKDILGKRTM